MALNLIGWILVTGYKYIYYNTNNHIDKPDGIDIGIDYKLKFVRKDVLEYITNFTTINTASTTIAHVVSMKQILAQLLPPLRIIMN